MAKSTYKNKPKANISSHSNKLYHRAAQISLNHIGKVIRIHTGKYFVGLMVTDAHVNYKFGSFVRTRRIFIKRKNKNKNKKKK